MLIALARNSSPTRPITTGRGKTRARLVASPWPVTRPILALIDWIATISG